MNVDQTGRQSNEDSILVGYGPASLGNQFPTFWKNIKRVLKPTFRYNGSASSSQAQCALNPIVSTTKPHEKLTLVVFLSYVQKTYHHVTGCWLGTTPDVLACHPGRYPPSFLCSAKDDPVLKTPDVYSITFTSGKEYNGQPGCLKWPGWKTTTGTAHIDNQKRVQ